MFFGENSLLGRNKFFKNMSLTKKVIIFTVLAIVAISVVILPDTIKKYSGNQTVKQPTVSSNTAISSANPLNKVDEVQKQKQTDEAKKAEEQEAKNKELAAINDKGQAVFFSKNYWGTLTIEDEVLKQDPNNYRALAIKGIALCYIGNSQYNDGLVLINQSIQIKPDYGYARFNKALAYEMVGKYDESLKLYDEALAVEQYAWSYYGKASIYGRRADVANTVANLQKAIELNPQAKEAAKTEEDYAPVRGTAEFQALLK